jgi:hypothetical protein
MSPTITNEKNTGAGKHSGNNNRIVKVDVRKEIMNYYSTKCGKQWKPLTVLSTITFDNVNIFGKNNLIWYLDYGKTKRGDTRLLLVTNINTNFHAGKKADMLVAVPMTSVVIQQPPTQYKKLPETLLSLIADRQDYCILRINTLSVKQAKTPIGNAIERALYHMVLMDIYGRLGISRIDLPPNSRYYTLFPSVVQHCKLSHVDLALDKTTMLQLFNTKLGI